jgi:hypothetical protein
MAQFKTYAQIIVRSAQLRLQTALTFRPGTSLRDRMPILRSAVAEAPQ